MNAPMNSLCGRIAALRGARFLAYLRGMSSSLRAARLALHPANEISGGTI